MPIPSVPSSSKPLDIVVPPCPAEVTAGPVPVPHSVEDIISWVRRWQQFFEQEAEGAPHIDTEAAFKARAGAYRFIADRLCDPTPLHEAAEVLSRPRRTPTAPQSARHPGRPVTP